MPQFQSVPDMIIKRVDATPDAIAFKYPDPHEQWQDLTWRQTEARIRAIALGVLELGLKPGERAAVMAKTSLEWILADYGVLCAAGATTTVYPSSTGEETAYILNDSNTRIVFVEDEDQVKKLASIKEKIPQVIKVIAFKGGPFHDPWLMRLSELEALGQGVHDRDPTLFRKTALSVKLDDLATLIYTSGTTGQPKGVELIHDAWVFEAEMMVKTEQIKHDNLQMLWLPLSHVFGKVLQVGQLTIGFPTAVDGRIDKLIDNLAIVKPHFSAAAPRIFEKVYNRIVTKAQASPIKYKMFKWARKVGLEYVKYKEKGQPAPAGLRAKFAIADAAVFAKLRQAFGGQLQFFISGSAPLSLDMAYFFYAAGIHIMEGYGMTESSAASCCNTPIAWRFGSVGKPLPGVEARIAEDGELMLKGRGVMRGYHNQPTLTRETLTPDGWLHTGDIARIDEDGFVFITDRKKDLIKTSGGKYVAPVLLEAKLKALCPYISQVLVHGDRRNFCTALVTVDMDSVGGWAKEHQVEMDSKKLSEHPDMIAAVQKAVDRMNADLASYQTIKRFAILPEDFTVEAGELTPSLKVKRKVVETKYKDVLDSFYEGAIAS